MYKRYFQESRESENLLKIISKDLANEIIKELFDKSIIFRTKLVGVNNHIKDWANTKGIINKKISDFNLPKNDFVKWLNDNNIIIRVKIVKNEKGNKELAYWEFNDKEKVLGLNIPNTSSFNNILMSFDINDYYSFFKNMKSISSKSGGLFRLILHELTHAYDDFQSDSKILKSFSKPTDIDSYLNSYMEINARWNEFVYQWEIRFENNPKDKTNLKVKSDFNTFKKLSTDDSIFNLHYDKLTPENKKKMDKRLYKYWKDEINV